MRLPRSRGPRRLGGGGGGGGGGPNIRLRLPRPEARPPAPEPYPAGAPFPPSLRDPHIAICVDGAGVDSYRPRLHPPLRPIPFPTPRHRERVRSPALPKAPRYGAARPCATRIPSRLQAPVRPEARCASLRDANAVVSEPGGESPSSLRPRPPPLPRQKNQKHKGRNPVRVRCLRKPIAYRGALS